MSKKINFITLSGTVLYEYDPTLPENIHLVTIEDIKNCYLNNIVNNYEEFFSTIVGNSVKSINYSLLIDDIEVKNHNIIKHFYNRNIIIVIFNDKKDYIRWFENNAKDFYLLYSRRLNVNEVKKNIMLNKNSISFLIELKDQYPIDLKSLSGNENGIDLLNSYIMDDNNKYSITKFVHHGLNNVKTLEFIFKNPNASRLIEWIIERLNSEHRDYVYFNFNSQEEEKKIFNSFALNKISPHYFYLNFSKITFIAFENFSYNSNINSLEVIKHVLDRYPNIFLDNIDLRNSYLENYQFIENILYDYDKYHLSIKEIDWRYICRNEYCKYTILKKIEEEKININLVKFINNQNFDYTTIYEKAKNIFDDDLKNIILKNSTNISHFLLNLSKDNLEHIIPSEIIKFVPNIEYTEKFLIFIQDNTIILKNPGLYKHILKILDDNQINYYLYEKFWTNISKNPNKKIIKKLLANFYTKIDWEEMSKQANAINYLLNKNSIRNINWNSLCANNSEKAIKILYLKILRENKDDIVLLNNMVESTLRELELEIENIDDEKINISDLKWINWEYLSLNSFAIVILNKYRDKIIWENLVKNKSEHCYLYNLIMYGYNIPNLFTEKIWNNLLANDNPVVFELIMIKLKYQKKNQPMTKLNWENLSKNSNPKIIELFNNNLNYRFNINWNEMSGNKNVYMLNDFTFKLRKIKIKNTWKRAFIRNNNKAFTDINTINISIFPMKKRVEMPNDYLTRKLDYWRTSFLPYNKNLDNILENYNIFSNQKIFIHKKEALENFKNFIIILMNDKEFYSKLLTNECALKTINKYKYLHSKSDFINFIPYLVTNPLFFCTEKEWKDTKEYL